MNHSKPAHLVLALPAAGFIASCLLLLTMTAGEFANISFEWRSIGEVLLAVLAGTLALAIYTIPLVTVLGVPVYFLLRRFGRLTPAFFIGAGALVGLVIGVQVGFNAHSLFFGSLFVLNGAASAAVGYWVLHRLARPRSDPLVNRR